MRCFDVLISVAGCFTLPVSKDGQLVQQWVATSSFWAGAGWWAARVIGRESSDPCNTPFNISVTPLDAQQFYLHQTFLKKNAKWLN